MSSLASLLWKITLLVSVAARPGPYKTYKPGLQGSAKKAAAKLVSSTQFKYQLRVCNAYPDEADLDVYKAHPTYPHAAEEKLTHFPLEYKMCGDFDASLLAGDKLKFFVGGGRAGTFTISDMPDNDAVLLLIVHRHDTSGTAVSFQSHVFANLQNAQVAVLDTYKGSNHGVPSIQDGSQAQEKLSFNSVVALSPGEYKVGLQVIPQVGGLYKVGEHKVGMPGSNQGLADLVALNKESYVILRVGVESTNGRQYPQELVVYPLSDAASLHSAAPRGASLCVAWLMALLVGFAGYQ